MLAWERGHVCLSAGHSGAGGLLLLLRPEEAPSRRDLGKHSAAMSGGERFSVRPSVHSWATRAGT